MKNTNKNKNIITSFTKVILYLVFVIGLICCFVNTPKEIITNDQIYTLCASMGDVGDSGVLLDYQVFGSEKRFEETLTTKPLEIISELKEQGDILLVRIYGEEYKRTFENDYWVIEDPNAIELNIEYYIVKNVNVLDTSLPVHTVYQLISDVLVKVNKAIYTIIGFITFGVSIPFIIGISKNVYYIGCYYSNKNKK